MNAIPSMSLLTVKPGKSRFIVIGLLALFMSFLIGSIRQESQTFDEPAHLFAGFEYWQHGDYGRNPEHPPLVKLLATIPLYPWAAKT